MPAEYEKIRDSDVDLKEIATLHAETESACDSCCTDDPPWNLIQRSFTDLNRLIAEVVHLRSELHLAQLSLRCISRNANAR